MQTALNLLFPRRDDESVPAFQTPTGALARSEFLRRVAATVNFFASCPETEIPIYAENPVTFAAWFFALLLAGKEPILLPHSKPGMISVIKKRYAVLLTDKEIPDVPRLAPPEDLPKKTLPLAPLSGRFVTFFTSGSTAEPKPIRKPFETLAAEVDFHLKNLPAEARAARCVVASVDMHHMLGLLHRLLVPFAGGICIDAETVFSPEDLLGKQKKFASVSLVTTPSFMEKIAAASAFSAFPRNCVRIVSSGSALKPDTARTVRELFGICPYEIYGSTETGGIAGRERGENWTLFPPVELVFDIENRPAVSSPFVAASPFRLSDALEMTGTREFRLLGRIDRLVKLSEHRVSLPEMEARFEAHAWIEEAHTLLLPTAKPQLGCALTLTQAGKDFLKSSTKREFVRKLKAAVGIFFEDSVFPKKIRIVYEIPKNAQGKILRERLLPLFENNIAEPVTEVVSREHDRVLLRATFLPDAVYFRGHFPEFQLLPGVVQVHFAVRFSRLFFNAKNLPGNIEKLKFSHVIRPRETTEVELLRDKDDVRFAFRCGENLCSSGILKGVCRV